MEYMHDMVQLITALGVCVAAALSYLNGQKIKQVHVQMNSRLTELLEETRRSAHLAGVDEERERNSKDKVSKGD
jgi:hypothetical protein